MSFAADKVRVLIATTNGPVEIQLLTEEDASIGRCVACIGGTTETADIAAAYHAFVVRPTGVIEGRFGHSCYRLDLSGRIDAGSSWQLGVLVAHALLAAGRLAQENEHADGVLWVTGSVRPVDLTVGPVSHIPEKLEKSLDRLTRERASGRRVLVAVPHANANEVTSAIARELLIQGISLATPPHAHALFDALDLKLPGNGGTKVTAAPSASKTTPAAAPEAIAPPPPPPPPPPAPPKSSSGRIYGIVAAVVLLLAAGAGAFMLKRSDTASDTASQSQQKETTVAAAPTPTPPPTKQSDSRSMTQPTPAPTPVPTTTPQLTPPPAPTPAPANPPPQAQNGCTYYRVNSTLLNVSKDAGSNTFIDVLEDGETACVMRQQTVNGDEWGFVEHKLDKTNTRVTVDGWSLLKSMAKLPGEPRTATSSPAPTAAPPAAPAPAAARPEDVLRFDQPIPFGPYPVNGHSIKELIEGEPLFPPVEGLDDSIWKKHCTSCHQWTQARLCEQGATYVKTPRNALRVPHPYGGPEKIALMRWVKSGCL